MIQRPLSLDEAINLLFESVFYGQELDGYARVPNIIELLLSQDLSPREREYVMEMWLTKSASMFRELPEE